MPSWVLLHGTPLTPSVWRDVADGLTDQAVLTPSCVDVVAAGPRPQQAIAEHVLASVEGDELDVVGHSFGGQVAIEVALAAPARLRSLTILCSRDSPFPDFALLAEQVRAGTPPALEASLARWFAPAEIDAALPAVGETWETLRLASLPEWAAALDAIATYDRRPQTASLDVPVVAVAAGRDGVSAPAVMQEMADRMPRARFRCEEGWGHMSPFAHPRELARLLTEERDAALAR